MIVLCGGCGQTVVVGDKVAGGDLLCPYCHRMLRISAMAGDAPAKNGPILGSYETDDDLTDDFLTHARLALKKKLLVVCASCGRRLEVDQRLAGGAGLCPACGGEVHISGSADWRSAGDD